MDTSFLHSTRFWAICLIAVVAYLEAKGMMGEAERELVWTIAGGFGIVRTLDRAVDKMSK